MQQTRRYCACVTVTEIGCRLELSRVSRTAVSETTMMREDFISFDNKNIDWGSILGEESEDDEVKPQITLKTIFTITCPVCDKE